MEKNKAKQIIEAILFCAGRSVEMKELITSLELGKEEILAIIEEMTLEFKERGIQIIQIEDSYQLATKEEFYEYIYPIVDKRNKPNLSQAALETLAIIAYHPKITRAQIEMIRGVNSDGTIYRLLEHNLIQEAGKMDAPGRPTMYETTEEFLKMFGYTSLKDLPELPRYKLDENKQIVIDEIIEQKENEVPSPESQEIEEN